MSRGGSRTEVRLSQPRKVLRPLKNDVALGALGFQAQKNILKMNWEWWLRPVSSALWRLRQEDYLDSRVVRATV